MRRRRGFGERLLLVGGVCGAFVPGVWAAAPPRAVPYAEEICRSDPHVFFCEDFEDPATQPLTTPGKGPDCSGTWPNPGFVASSYCWNQGGRIASPALTVPANSPSGQYAYQIPIGNGAIDGYLKKGGAGTAYTDYDIRYQFYYSPDVRWPNDLDIKQMLSHPEVFLDPPSANYQNGVYLHEDYHCSGVGNFGDVISLRYGPAYHQFPYQDEYCPPLHPGEPANNKNAVRLQKDRWYTVEVHFTLGNQNSTGFMEAWLDGNLMYRANRATCAGKCPPMSYVYFTGYKSPYESNFDGHVQYDNIVMSTRYIGPPQSSAPAPLRGDLDGDGRVTLGDLLILIRMLIGQVPVDLVAADLNGDGLISLADVRALVSTLGRGS